MADFRKVDYTWLNFDKIITTWVEPCHYFEGKETYKIKASRGDGDPIYLFEAHFDTREEAQEYLDEFMAAHLLADK